MLFLPGDWLASSGVFLQPCTLFCETKLREFVVSLPPQYVFWTEHSRRLAVLNALTNLVRSTGWRGTFPSGA